jgi:hypothetical protein
MRNTQRRAGIGIAIAAMLTACASTAATAADPVAIVEDIKASGVDLQFMDYVEAGRVISLGATGTVTLGYLGSCMQETITGGRVTVGSEQSRVDGGKVKRMRVECDGGDLKLSTEQAGKSAVLVLRLPPGARKSARQKPSLTIYGASPVIALSDPADGTASVVITRLDRPEDDIEVRLSGGIADLSSGGRSLRPGGIYRAESGGRTVVFKVDPFAEPGAGPLIGRLIRF